MKVKIIGDGVASLYIGQTPNSNLDCDSEQDPNMEENVARLPVFSREVFFVRVINRDSTRHENHLLI